MKSFVQRCLAHCAKRTLKRAKPDVIGITGSVGKSSTKQAVGAVLGRKFAARVSPKNYNTEFGLPLAVLGLTVGRNALGWFSVLCRAVVRSCCVRKDYPKTLVLEMAADRPGDIALLCDIAAPRIGVVTAVAESHVEFFGSVDNVAKEKQTLVQRLPRDGAAVLNRDDERVWAMREKTKARVTSFGFHEEADVRALEPSMSYSLDEKGECGMHFKLSAGGSAVPVFLPNVLGRQAVYAALAAAAVGLVKGMNLVEISDGLRGYEPPPGRMRCLPGIKRTMLIDDTYNSAPRSAAAALETLRDISLGEAQRKLAVLGDMLELGPLSQEGHEAIGRKAAECGLDLLVFVGERMGDAEKAALAAGFPADHVFHFSSGEEAGRFAQERMKQGDVVLIKGSRGMRLERTIKELMAEPLMAEKLLVESDEDWKW